MGTSCSDLGYEIPVVTVIEVSYLYFMKNTGNITNTQNNEFKCENPTNKDIDIIDV